MTNREWLESLSDEELAKNLVSCKYCIYRVSCREYPITRGCYRGHYEWLQAEHKEKED